ncbi:MAG: hypothetical protein BMS9Abin19_1039 [Gammaproteobacteria bacterium]|nr:MAG: hypothetical protein BMS9Abin19_1039 [Gammaproteobacteria bacterium]
MPHPVAEVIRRKARTGIIDGISETYSPQRHREHRVLLLSGTPKVLLTIIGFPLCPLRLCGEKLFKLFPAFMLFQ